MPQNTTKLNIPKPLGNEYLNRTEFNNILDTIDSNAGSQIEINSRQIENIGYGVQSGLNVLATATPDMNVHVQTGVIYMPDGKRFEFTTITDKAITTSDATNPRKDIIYVSSAGTITYLAGTPAATSLEPILPAGAIKLCAIDVPANDTTIEQTQITDSRILKDNLPSLRQTVAAHTAEKATDTTLGHVTVDGTTITVDGNGKISAGIVPACRVFNSANQSLANATFTLVNFDSELFDTNNMHYIDNTISRLICRTPGKYLIVANIAFAQNTTGMRIVQITHKDGALMAESTMNSVSGEKTALVVSTIADLLVEDFIEVFAYQNSGGSLDIVRDSNATNFFSMVRVG